MQLKNTEYRELSRSTFEPTKFWKSPQTTSFPSSFYMAAVLAQTAVSPHYLCGLKLSAESAHNFKIFLKIYTTLVHLIHMCSTVTCFYPLFEYYCTNKGPVREGEQWRIRSNRESEEILRGEDVVKFVKSQWLAWLGHVQRMDEEKMLRKLLHGRMEGSRRGRPRKRLLPDMEEDLRVMQIGRWWKKVQSKSGGAL
jgi:hypothetical protein